jgi:hypothetical protein
MSSSFARLVVVAMAVLSVVANMASTAEPRKPTPEPSDQPAEKENAKPDDPTAMADAQKARAALLNLIEKNDKSFPDRPDPNRFRQLPIRRSAPSDPHLFSWGAFQIDVKNRRYTADIIGKNMVWMHSYSGTFTVSRSGRWVAQKPLVSYLDSFPKGL